MVNFITPILGIFGTWLSNKQELNKIKQLGKVEQEKEKQALKTEKIKAQIERTKKGQSNRFSLDEQTVKDMATTLKDEFILISFYAPVILAFFGYSDVVLKGFDSLEKMPNWYVLIVVLLAVTTSGMRGLFMEIVSKIPNFNLFKKEKNG